MAGPRRALRAEFARRLARLRADLREFLLGSYAAVWYDAPGRLEAFSRWLDAALARHLLAGQWWASHVRDAFLRGAGRVYDEVRKVALRDPAMHAGGKAEFLRGLLERRPFGMAVLGNVMLEHRPLEGSVVANALGIGERLRLLAVRLGEAVRGLAGQIASRLVQAVAALLGTEPRPEALLRAVRAELAGITPRVAALVATHLTTAHASGQLAGMAELGVVEVEAEVEWVRQAGACPKCRGMAGRRFTLAEAEGMIPAHFSCRCAWRVARG